MENSTLKAENIKLIILKAGVPLAVSLAGLIYAWIITRKSLSKISSFSENNSYTLENEINSHDDENFSSIDSNVLCSSLEVHENHSCLEQEITCLRSKVEGMKIRELALTLQFVKYCEMKEKEYMLMEVKNILLMEASRVEFFDREISFIETSFIETETIKLENFVKVEYLKSENRVLEKEVKKLLKKSMAQTLMIKEGEDELSKRASVINNLLEDKNEAMKKLQMLEGKEKLHRKPLKYYLQVESRDAMMEDYNKIVNELEHVKMEHEIVVEELRKELMKHELHCSFLDHHQNVSCFGSSSSSHGDPSCSKKGKLIKRLKKWW